MYNEITVESGHNKKLYLFAVWLKNDHLTKLFGLGCNQKHVLIWLRVQKGFGPIALSSQFPVFSTSIWPLLPNLLSCFETWKPFLCQLIDVVLHRKVCSQSPI